MIKHFQRDEATKDSIYISEDYTVWGSSDSINRLSDHLDDLEDDIKSLKASELAHRLLYERTKEQNALMVEALEQIGSSSRCCEAHEDRHKCPDIYANKADWCDYCVAKAALAAVKEADKSAKGGE